MIAFYVRDLGRNELSQGGARVIAILPRVRIQKHGAPHNQSCAVGPVTIWHDSDALWPTQFNRARPSWLDIFREFPNRADNEPNAVNGLEHSNVQFEVPVRSYGSITTCDDSEWLRKNLDHLVSVLYFLAEPTGDFARPAECFEFFTLNPDAGQNDHVGLFTKAGEKIESAGSLILTPSLPLRAANRIAPLRLDLDYCNELVTLISEDPNDRLVVACRHFFRASFEGIFQSPWEQDVAAYCACLEAAFDIPEGKYKEALMDATEDLLGESVALRELIAGAYAIRSVLNHGAVAIEGDNRTELLKKFREHPAINLQTLRHVCAFAIQERLLDSAEARRTAVDRAMRRSSNHDFKRIEQRFNSDELWKELSKRFADKDAINSFTQLTSENEDECLDFCCRFLNSHSWEFGTELPTASSFIQVLRTMSCTFGLLAKKLGNSTLESRGMSLYDAIKNKHFNELMQWYYDNGSDAKYRVGVTLCETIFSSTHHVACLVGNSTFRETVKQYLEPTPAPASEEST